MTSQQEQIERKIERLHQEKVEKELDEINDTFQSYTSRIEESTKKRRRENIYVLLALGIVGAFFSAVPKETFPLTGSLLMGFGVFVFASLIFLFIKLNTVAFLPSGESGGKMDNYSEYIFAFSINGILVLVAGVVFVNIMGIDTDAIATGSSIIGAVLVALFITAAGELLEERYKRKKRKQRRDDMKAKREEHREELVDKISEHITELNTEHNKKESLSIYSEISQLIQWIKNEGAGEEEVAELSGVLDDQDGIPTHFSESIKEQLEEIIEEPEDELEEEKKIEETLEELRLELEGVESQKSGV